MKKIFLLFVIILTLTSCNFGEKKQENPKTSSGNIEKVNLKKEVKSVEENSMEDFALKIGMKKEDIKKGKYFYPGGKEEEGFQIINPKYPNSKYTELEKLFEGWEMNLPPADGDIETSVWHEKGNMICRLHTKVNATEEEIENGDYGRVKDRTVTITCFSKENKKSDHSQKQSLFLEAFGDEPAWDIKIVGNNLKYSSPDENVEESINYQIDSIKKEGENIAFEGEKVKGIFEKKDCMSDGFGVELPYTVELTIEDTSYTGCGEEVLDDFFVEGKTGKCNEIAKKIGIDIKNIADCEYSIGAMYGPYFDLGFSYEVGGYAGVYKKNVEGYETVWEGQDISMKDCVNVVNNHSRLVYNEEFPILSDCEERVKNAQGDEIDQIYKNDKENEEVDLMSTNEGMEDQNPCVSSALALVREGAEVKSYIENMEKILGENSENIGEVTESLKSFGLELEQTEEEAFFFALKETHREADGTQRDSTTKRFRIKNDTLLPEEYDIITDSYNALSMGVSGDELQKLKNNYKKGCGIE